MSKIANGLRLLAFLVGIFTIPIASAEPTSNLEQNLKNLSPNVSVTGVRETPIPSILEIEVNGSQIIYASIDGNYVLTGQLMDISEGQSNNLTERSLRDIRIRVLSELNPRTFITYKAEGIAQSEVYVFTDVTCEYCKNFHKQIKDINKSGVTVHYIAFPRSGISTPAAKLMEAAWCSENPQAALTELKASGRSSLNTIPCQAPIEEHFQTGLSIGVNGTPYIITTDGRNLGGYLSKDDLLSALE